MTLNHWIPRILTALSLLSISLAQATQVTLRTAPVYFFDGRLNEVMVVVNLRTASGQPDSTAVNDWTVTGPPGWSTLHWTGPTPDGFVWQEGHIGYLPGLYTLNGTVNGQKVQVQTTAPKVAKTVAPFSPQVAVSSNWTAPFCSGGWPCWDEPRPDVTGVPANTLVVSLKTVPNEADHFGIAILSLKASGGQGMFRKSWGGKFAFPGLPDAFLHSPMYMDLLSFNVPSLFAPQNQLSQPLVVHRVLSRYFSLDQVSTTAWSNATWIDKK
ncbi:hypothetical protein [Deinococcus sp. UYEF24]